MFHAPMSEPTARRMNTAERAEEMPPTTASRTRTTVWPFLSATNPATIVLVSSATCRGPPVASVPNSQIVRPIRPTRVTTGMIASSSDGSRIRDASSSPTGTWSFMGAPVTP